MIQPNMSKKTHIMLMLKKQPRSGLSTADNPLCGCLIHSILKNLPLLRHRFLRRSSSYHCWRYKKKQPRSGLSTADNPLCGCLIHSILKNLPLLRHRFLRRSSSYHCWRYKEHCPGSGWFLLWQWRPFPH